MRHVGKMDYIDRGHHIFGAKSPKYMCTNCFRIFSKRDEGDSATQRCICGNRDLVCLDPRVPIPRRKASSKKWKEFFDRNFLSNKAKLYYQVFKTIRLEK